MLNSQGEKTALLGMDRRLALESGVTLYHGDKGCRVIRVPNFHQRMMLLPYGYLGHFRAMNSEAGSLFQKWVQQYF
jgi:hypothetical protein